MSKLSEVIVLGEQSVPGASAVCSLEDVLEVFDVPVCEYFDGVRVDERAGGLPAVVDDLFDAGLSPLLVLFACALQVHFDGLLDSSLRLVEQPGLEELHAVLVVHQRLLLELFDLLLLPVDELFVPEQEVVEALVEVVRGLVRGRLERAFFEVDLLRLLRELFSLQSRVFIEAFVDGGFCWNVAVGGFPFDLDDLMASAD